MNPKMSETEVRGRAPLCVGFATDASQKAWFHRFADAAAASGIPLVDVTAAQGTEDLNGIDIVLHKLADYGDTSRVPWACSQPSAVLDRVAASAILDDRLSSLKEVEQALSDVPSVSIPPWCYVPPNTSTEAVHELLQANGLTYPLICKQRASNGRARCRFIHEGPQLETSLMTFDNQPTSKRGAIVQKFIAHNGVLWTVYVIGQQEGGAPVVACVQRSGLVDADAMSLGVGADVASPLTAGTLISRFFGRSRDVDSTSSDGGTDVSRVSRAVPSDELAGAKPPTDAMLVAAYALKRQLGVSLFSFDFVTCAPGAGPIGRKAAAANATTPQHYILGVDYFPSYSRVPHAYELLLAQLEAVVASRRASHQAASAASERNPRQPQASSSREVPTAKSSSRGPWDEWLLLRSHEGYGQTEGTATGTATAAGESTATGAPGSCAGATRVTPGSPSPAAAMAMESVLPLAAPIFQDPHDVNVHWLSVPAHLLPLVLGGVAQGAQKQEQKQQQKQAVGETSASAPPHASQSQQQSRQSTSRASASSPSTHIIIPSTGLPFPVTIGDSLRMRAVSMASSKQHDDDGSQDVDVDAYADVASLSASGTTVSTAPVGERSGPSRRRSSISTLLGLPAYEGAFDTASISEALTSVQQQAAAVGTTIKGSLAGAWRAITTGSGDSAQKKHQRRGSGVVPAPWPWRMPPSSGGIIAPGDVGDGYGHGDGMTDGQQLAGEASPADNYMHHDERACCDEINASIVSPAGGTNASTTNGSNSSSAARTRSDSWRDAAVVGGVAAFVGIGAAILVANRSSRTGIEGSAAISSATSRGPAGVGITPSSTDVSSGAAAVKAAMSINDQRSSRDAAYIAQAAASVARTARPQWWSAAM